MNTKMPVLILHARDDIVIPFKLGERVKYKYIFDYNLYIILNERNMLIYFKCWPICTIIYGFHKIFINLMYFVIIFMDVILIFFTVISSSVEN